jgi:catechol 2,3-dioxygenase-like lactoylglutathione lyase family enzyme
MRGYNGREMRRYIRGIDHAVILTRDLDRAHAAYVRLGFTLTPRGHHTLGSQNHCIVFERDYLELMAVPQPHPALQSFVDYLAGGEGLGALALATEDAGAAQAELVEAGVAADPPLDLSRPVEGLGDASFRIAQLPVAQTPGCRTFACQHFTPEIVWRAEWQCHANGVAGISAIAVIVDEPDAAVARYAQVFDTRPQQVDGGILVPTGGAPVALGSRERLEQRLPGVGLPPRAPSVIAAVFLRVADRDRAAEVLRAGGVRPIRLEDGAWAVSTEDACGVALVFG